MPYLNYLDTIRFAAMLMVMACHACDPFNAGATYGTGEANADMFLWGSIWGSSVRACVPLFVMLTGILNLPTTMPMQTYWKRRITRVLWPFLIWSTIYNLFPWFIGMLGLPESTVYDFFVWASSSSPALSDNLSRVAEIPFKFHYIACHMWYIYMLIGLYLFMPILSAWVATATKRQIELVLLIWLASTFLPYLHEFSGKYLFGECEWSTFGTFYYFSGFTGYLLLGYYIVKYIPAKVTPTLTFAIISFLCGLAITYFGFSHMTAQPDATPEQTELFWSYCTPNVMLMTIAIFTVLRLVPIKGWIAKALSNFTVCGFGIYMIHYFFVGPTYHWIETLSLPTGLRIPAATILIMAASWSLVALVKQLYKHSRWLLG
ncbi:MAG: acyltransferase family protein [Paramuribaculum sp.]|nr:acyltransferase family protein [Paramuribaculum sp.]